MASLITTVSVLITILSLQQHNFIMAILTIHSEPLSNNLFARDLLPFIFDNKSTQNVVYSPASIYTSLAFVYSVTKGKTASEIRRVLRLNQEDKKCFAMKYDEFIRNTFTKTETEIDTPQISMANGLYVSNKIQIAEQFNETAQRNFNAKIENVDFSQPLMAVKKINKWTEQQTNNGITNIMQPNAVNKSTTAVLVNAIYFKARLLHPFIKQYSVRGDFHISPSEKVKTDVMIADGQFGYVELDGLNAKVIEMPYENSDISILLILPNETFGLEKLEKTLKQIDLNDITSKLVVQRVAAVVPKFRIQFDINLKETLVKMGCSSMFVQNTDFNDILKSAKTLNILDIRHKAVFDFSEGGSDEAIVNEKKLEALYLDPNQKLFYGLHPFFFIVRSKTTVFYAGHFARF